MNLIIDQGNTFCKLALFDGDEMFQQFKVENKQIDTLKESLRSFTIERAILATVSDASALIAILDDLQITWVTLGAHSVLPIALRYETPETLGLDRIAAAVGAWKLSPNTCNLIIDIGTAVTYDISTPQEGFLGGNIAPGLDMRLEALHHFTQRLPLTQRRENAHYFARSTTEALQNGAQIGIVAEINHYIDYALHKYGDISVFLTGGDASFFEKKIKNSIFVVPNLLMIGLLEILKNN